MACPVDHAFGAENQTLVAKRDVPPNAGFPASGQPVTVTVVWRYDVFTAYKTKVAAMLASFVLGRVRCCLSLVFAGGSTVTRRPLRGVSVYRGYS